MTPYDLMFFNTLNFSCVTREVDNTRQYRVSSHKGGGVVTSPNFWKLGSACDKKLDPIGSKVVQK